MTASTPIHAGLIAGVLQLVADARRLVEVAVNAKQTGLCWQAGQRMHREILGSQQAVHGAEIVSALSRRWLADFGRGSSVKNLRHKERLARAFLDEAIAPRCGDNGAGRT